MRRELGFGGPPVSEAVLETGSDVSYRHAKVLWPITVRSAQLYVVDLQLGDAITTSAAARDDNTGGIGAVAYKFDCRV